MSKTCDYLEDTLFRLYFQEQFDMFEPKPNPECGDIFNERNRATLRMVVSAKDDNYKHYTKGASDRIRYCKNNSLSKMKQDHLIVLDKTKELVVSKFVW
jgi:hypothetical protein